MKNIEQLNDTQIKEKILSVLKGGDILFIVPPFACINYPAFALHVLQSTARESGYKTEILYLNILLTKYIGGDVARAIMVHPSFALWKMLGERLFARSAYGLPPLGKAPESCEDENLSIAGNEKGYVKTYYECENFDLDTYKKIEPICKSFIDTAVPVIASLRYKIIGCTNSFEQTNASIAILTRIKQAHADIVTLMGGANCREDMAEGIASLSDSIDYIFSGESELSLSKFLQGYSRGQFPPGRIIRGEPLQDLDNLSLPDYDAFIEQLHMFLGPDAPKEIAISYETSRGCWWGQKKKCSFCGLTNVRFRKKTGKKVLEDLEKLNKLYPNANIFMIDYIMPYSYHQELVPRLSQKKYSNIHYMQKANLKLKELINLKAAGIDMVTPGIEALSTALLKLANKGVTARENLYLLRNARSLGIYLNWYLLWGFPGDKAIYYRETLDLIPLIHHLQPSSGLLHILLERFSSYIKNPTGYGIRNFRPWAVYNHVYPEGARIDQLAFFYTADYPCESHTHPGLIKELFNELELWKKVWNKSILAMAPFTDFYIVHDGRPVSGKGKKHVLDEQQAREIMTTCLYKDSETLRWALQEKLGVIVDSWYVPIVTASPGLLLKFAEKG